jgi:anti-sigma factor RsiW
VDCRDVRNLLHAYSDGELDLVRHLQMEHHLAECTACADREQGVRQLREAFTATPLYHRAPDALRARIQTVQLEPPTPNRRRGRWSFAPVAAGGAAVAATLFIAGVILMRHGPSADDRLTDQLLAGHVRSLQVDHLKDVASTDRHTVKPWFRGKLDFSPHVPDLATDGFPLTGGRLDYVVERPVAALVYTRRQHVINLFTWPEASDDGRPARSTSRQGFHVSTWHHGGMAYSAVSDLNAEELDEFVRLFRHTLEGQPSGPESKE